MYIPMGFSKQYKVSTWIVRGLCYVQSINADRTIDIGLEVA